MSRRVTVCRASYAALVIISVCVPACAKRNPTQAESGDDFDVASLVANAPADDVATSDIGMVVSGAPLATAVGVRVLEEGGNAVDAAVALAFALAVVEPTQSGIGGRTQLLVRTSDGAVAAIDGTTEVPASYRSGPADDEDAYGYGTIAVPGTVAALTTALRTHGTWPLARILAPAIALAQDGFPLSAEEAARIGGARDRLLEFPASADAFLADDEVIAGGATFRQADLARTLRIIADQGADAFYRGEIAEMIARDMAANGGLVTREDLARYRAEESIVVRGRYRGHEIIGSYLPASGATVIGILEIMERFDLPAIAGSADWVSIVAQSLLAGFADRGTVMEPAEAKAAWLVSDSLADRRAAAIRTTDNHRLGSQGSEPEPAHTTHVSVADREGNVVALTQSIGPNMGSKVVTAGLGFVYAATMEYLGELEPGTRRHWSSQAPLLIVRDDRPVWVLGGGGARRILSAIVETVSRSLDQGLAPEAALAAPRFHPVPARLDIEVREGASFSPTVRDSLRTMGIRIDERDSGPYFARLNAIHRSADGTWTGIADSRWQGSAGAPRR
jgi:gamma-glutamyltranspeptidase/glutathione hydrolase